jgi:hypothetical protein
MRDGYLRFMRATTPITYTLPFALALLACGGAAAPVDSDGDGTISPQELQQAERAPAPSKDYQEGRDYIVLERLRVVDPSGFAQPMEAYSILVPRGWKSEGGITWQVGNPCMVEAIRNRVRATSPDGKFQLDIYPTQQWEWWDNQLMLQTMMQQQQNPVFRRCPIAQPMSAADFLRGPMAQEMGAEVVGIEPEPQMNARLQQVASQANAQFRQNNLPMENRPSAASAALRFPDGSSGVALCTVGMTVTWAPDMINGGSYASYTCATDTKISMRCPPGQEAEARRLLGTVMSSFRINPEWQRGVQQMVSNVAAVERRETMKRAQIQREAMNHTAELQQRTWEAGQESRDRIAEGWSQTLRGVESWSDGQGGTIELTGGYNEAWQRPDGTYILSNDPLFNPSVVFQENWQRLEKRR